MSQYPGPYYQQPVVQPIMQPVQPVQPMMMAQPMVAVDPRYMEGQKLAQDSHTLGLCALIGSLIGLGLISFVLGILAINKAGQAEQMGVYESNGRGMGWAGIIISSIVVIITLFWFFFIFVIAAAAPSSSYYY